MNEEALLLSYETAKSNGYNGTIEDYSSLLSENTEALGMAYDDALQEGYTDSIEDFANLLGVKKKGSSEELPQEVSIFPSGILDPLEDLPSISESEGSSAASSTVEEEKPKYDPFKDGVWIGYNEDGTPKFSNDPASVAKSLSDQSAKEEESVGLPNFDASQPRQRKAVALPKSEFDEESKNILIPNPEVYGEVGYVESLRKGDDPFYKAFSFGEYTPEVSNYLVGLTDARNSVFSGIKNKVLSSEDFQQSIAKDQDLFGKYKGKYSALPRELFEKTNDEITEYLDRFGLTLDDFFFESEDEASDFTHEVGLAMVNRGHVRDTWFTDPSPATEKAVRLLHRLATEDAAKIDESTAQWLESKDDPTAALVWQPFSYQDTGTKTALSGRAGAKIGRNEYNYSMGRDYAYLVDDKFLEDKAQTLFSTYFNSEFEGEGKGQIREIAIENIPEGLKQNVDAVNAIDDYIFNDLGVGLDLTGDRTYNDKPLSVQMSESFSRGITSTFSNPLQNIVMAIQGVEKQERADILNKKQQEAMEGVTIIDKSIGEAFAEGDFRGATNMIASGIAENSPQLALAAMTGGRGGAISKVAGPTVLGYSSYVNASTMAYTDPRFSHLTDSEKAGFAMRTGLRDGAAQVLFQSAVQGTGMFKGFSGKTQKLMTRAYDQSRLQFATRWSAGFLMRTGSAISADAAGEAAIEALNYADEISVTKGEFNFSELNRRMQLAAATAAGMTGAGSAVSAARSTSLNSANFASERAFFYENAVQSAQIKAVDKALSSEKLTPEAELELRQRKDDLVKQRDAEFDLQMTERARFFEMMKRRFPEQSKRLEQLNVEINQYVAKSADPNVTDAEKRAYKGQIDSRLKEIQSIKKLYQNESLGLTNKEQASYLEETISGIINRVNADMDVDRNQLAGVEAAIEDFANLSTDFDADVDIDALRARAATMSQRISEQAESIKELQEAVADLMQAEGDGLDDVLNDVRQVLTKYISAESVDMFAPERVVETEDGGEQVVTPIEEALDFSDIEEKAAAPTEPVTIEPKENEVVVIEGDAMLEEGMVAGLTAERAAFINEMAAVARQRGIERVVVLDAKTAKEKFGEAFIARVQDGVIYISPEAYTNASIMESKAGVEVKSFERHMLEEVMHPFISESWSGLTRKRQLDTLNESMSMVADPAFDGLRDRIVLKIMSYAAARNMDGALTYDPNTNKFSISEDFSSEEFNDLISMLTEEGAMEVPLMYAEAVANNDKDTLANFDLSLKDRIRVFLKNLLSSLGVKLNLDSDKAVVDMMIAFSQARQGNAKIKVKGMDAVIQPEANQGQTPRTQALFRMIFRAQYDGVITPKEAKELKGKLGILDRSKAQTDDAIDNALDTYESQLRDKITRKYRAAGRMAPKTRESALVMPIIDKYSNGKIDDGLKQFSEVKKEYAGADISDRSFLHALWTESVQQEAKDFLSLDIPSRIAVASKQYGRIASFQNNTTAWVDENFGSVRPTDIIDMTASKMSELNRQAASQNSAIPRQETMDMLGNLITAATGMDVDAAHNLLIDAVQRIDYRLDTKNTDRGAMLTADIIPQAVVDRMNSEPLEKINDLFMGESVKGQSGEVYHFKDIENALSTDSDGRVVVSPRIVSMLSAKIGGGKTVAQDIFGDAEGTMFLNLMGDKEVVNIDDSLRRLAGQLSGQFEANDESSDAVVRSVAREMNVSPADAANFMRQDEGLLNKDGFVKSLTDGPTPEQEVTLYRESSGLVSMKAKKENADSSRLYSKRPSPKEGKATVVSNAKLSVDQKAVDAFLEFGGEEVEMQSVVGTEAIESDAIAVDFDGVRVLFDPFRANAFTDVEGRPIGGVEELTLYNGEGYARGEIEYLDSDGLVSPKQRVVPNRFLDPAEAYDDSITIAAIGAVNGMVLHRSEAIANQMTTTQREKLRSSSFARDSRGLFLNRSSDRVMRRFAERMTYVTNQEARQAIIDDAENYLTPVSFKQIKGEYEKLSNEDLLGLVKDLKLRELAKAQNDFGVLAGAELLRRSIQSGDESSVPDLVRELAAMGTSAGRLLRQYAEMKTSTPEGFLLAFMSQVEKGGKKPKRKPKREQPEKPKTTEEQLEEQLYSEKLSPETFAKLKSIIREMFAAQQEYDRLKDIAIETGQNEAELKAAEKRLRIVRKDLSTLANSVIEKGWGDIFTGLVQGNLLVPMTHSTNFFANLMHVLAFQFYDPISVPIEKLLNLMGIDSKTERQFSLSGYLKSWKDMALSFPKTTMSELKGYDPDVQAEWNVEKNIFAIRSLVTLMANRKDLPRNSRGRASLNQQAKLFTQGTFGAVADFNFSLLTIGDVPFRTFGTSALLYQMGKARGLKGDDLKQFVKHPPKEDLQLADEQGAVLTHQNQSSLSDAAVMLSSDFVRRVGGLMTYASGGLINGEQLAKAILRGLVLPFIKTPTNILHETFTFIYPWYALARSGKAIYQGDAKNAAQHLAKAVIGQAMIQTALVLIKNGLLSEPVEYGDDDEKKRNLQRNTIGYNAINVSGLQRYLAGEDPTPRPGDRIRTIERLGILGTSMAGVAMSVSREELQDRDLDMTKSSEMFSRFLGLDAMSAGPAMLKQTFLQGTQGFLKVLSTENESQQDRALAQFVSSMFRAGSASVLPNVLSSITRYDNEYIPDRHYDKDASWEKQALDQINFTLKERLFMTEEIPPMIDWRGERVKSTPEGADPLAYHFYDVTKAQDFTADPVTNETFSLFMETGQLADIVGEKNIAKKRKQPVPKKPRERAKQIAINKYNKEREDQGLPPINFLEDPTFAQSVRFSQDQRLAIAEALYKERYSNVMEVMASEEYKGRNADEQLAILNSINDLYGSAIQLEADITLGESRDRVRKERELKEYSKIVLNAFQEIYEERKREAVGED